MCLFLRIQISPFFFSLFFWGIPFLHSSAPTPTDASATWAGAGRTAARWCCWPRHCQRRHCQRRRIQLKWRRKKLHMVSGGIQGLCWPSNEGRAVLPCWLASLSLSLSLSVWLTREKSKSNRIRLYSTERNVTLINLANPACYGGATVTVKEKNQ